MKKLHFYLALSIQISIVFITMIFISFIPDNFHNFFGDTYCLGNVGGAKCVGGWQDQHGIEWHWGYRHFIWAIMGAVLFIIQAARIIEFVDNRNNR